MFYTYTFLPHSFLLEQQQKRKKIYLEISNIGNQTCKNGLYFKLSKRTLPSYVISLIKCHKIQVLHINMRDSVKIA